MHMHIFMHMHIVMQMHIFMHMQFLCICIFLCICMLAFFYSKSRLLIDMYPLQKGRGQLSIQRCNSQRRIMYSSWIKESHQKFFFTNCDILPLYWSTSCVWRYLIIQARKIVFSLVSDHGPFPLLDCFCDKIDFCLESWWWRQPEPHLKWRLYWHLL